MKIKFVCNAVEWFDRGPGNTYYSVRIVRTSDGKVIAVQWRYGYGDQYRHTAITAMSEARWIPKKYQEEPYMYERENNYPVLWFVSQGTKKECIANGIL